MLDVAPMATGVILLVIFSILFGIGLRVLFAVLSYKIGKRKGQELTGLLLGIFLGWIGLIIVAVLPDESRPAYTSQSTSEVQGTRVCRHCSRQVADNARFCPYCGHSLGE